MKYCHSAADIPKEPHFAIITSDYVNIPGDERSRQYPGHGYPATTKQFVGYIAYTNKEEWEAEIAARTRESGMRRNDHFVALAVTPATINTEVSVTIALPKDGGQR